MYLLYGRCFVFFFYKKAKLPGHPHQLPAMPLSCGKTLDLTWWIHILSEPRVTS